jgi:hypothetical protein
MGCVQSSACRSTHDAAVPLQSAARSTPAMVATCCDATPATPLCFRSEQRETGLETPTGYREARAHERSECACRRGAARRGCVSRCRGEDRKWLATRCDATPATHLCFRSEQRETGLETPTGYREARAHERSEWCCRRGAARRGCVSRCRGEARKWVATRCDATPATHLCFRSEQRETGLEPATFSLGS